MYEQDAQQLFAEFSGQPAAHWEKIPQNGSARENFIAEDTAGQRFIVTENGNLRENEAFFYFTQVFSDLKLNTPQIFQISADRKTYVQTYLGSRTLSEIIAAEGLSGRVKVLVKQVLKQLYQLQKATAGKVDYRKTFEYENYGELSIMHDLNYFKFMFADVLGLDYHKSTLLKEFKTIADEVEGFQPKVLMIRDFQARNILVNDNDETFFIDYQSAMEGPTMYDVVSFLYQAKANFPESFKAEMVDFFIEQYGAQEKFEMKESVGFLLLMRYLQVLGAYGFRGLVQRKTHFLESIPKGVQNLVQFSENWQEMHRFPELLRVIQNLNSEAAKAKINALIIGG